MKKKKINPTVAFENRGSTLRFYLSTWQARRLSKTLKKSGWRRVAAGTRAKRKNIPPK